MKISKKISLILLSILFYHSFIQADTIKMMQYNMLYYTTSVPSGCEITSSYLNDKDLNLKKISNMKIRMFFV